MKKESEGKTKINQYLFGCVPVTYKKKVKRKSKNGWFNIFWASGQIPMQVPNASMLKAASNFIFNLVIDIVGKIIIYCPSLVVLEWRMVNHSLYDKGGDILLFASQAHWRLWCKYVKIRCIRERVLNVAAFLCTWQSYHPRWEIWWLWRMTLKESWCVTTVHAVDVIGGSRGWTLTWTLDHGRRMIYPPGGVEYTLSDSLFPTVIRLQNDPSIS